MRVVLDTNVLVSGVFFKGPPFQILHLWKSGHLEIVISHDIFIEYSRVLQEIGKQFPHIDTTQIMDSVALHARHSFSIVLPNPVCDDPDDDKFFSAALASRSKLIISGDKHLLSKSGFSGIKVLRPQEFLRNL